MQSTNGSNHNTRCGGQARPARRVIPARTPAPTPVVEAATIPPMEEEDIPNARALQDLKPKDDLNQVPALYFN